MTSLHERIAWILVGALALTVAALVAGIVRAGPLDPPLPAAGPTGTQKTQNEIEPRTPISSLPYTISVSGAYYLTANLTSGGGSDGITISADDVDLDLGGFSIVGASTFSGINATGKNVRVRNGTLRNWSVGMSSTGGAENIWASDMTVRDTTLQGFNFPSPLSGVQGVGVINPGADAIYIGGEDGRVYQVKVSGSGGVGINVAGARTRVEDASVTNSGSAGVSVTAPDVSINRTTVTTTGTECLKFGSDGAHVDYGTTLLFCGTDGVTVAAGTQGTSLWNFTVRNATGAGIVWSGSRGSIRNAQVLNSGTKALFTTPTSSFVQAQWSEFRGNTSPALLVDMQGQAHIFQENTVSGSSGGGLSVSGNNAVVLDSTITGNAGNGATLSGNGGTFDHNVVSNNAANGVLIAGGSGWLVIRVDAQGNGTGGASSGIHVSAGASNVTVRDNHAAVNTGWGITNLSPSSAVYQNAAKGNTVANLNTPVGDAGPVAAAAASGPSSNNIDP